MNSWHVGVAAEAIAAAQFARYTYDVSVQYGANQPEYDLIAVSGDKMLKISVKGSQDGSWGLTQSFKKYLSRSGTGMVESSPQENHFLLGAIQECR